MAEYFAHSKNNKGIKHDLIERLTNVARRAAEFAGKFGAVVMRGYWVRRCTLLRKNGMIARPV